jgi:uncharacterized membrane protein YjfL (UPF0719 family)
MIEFRPANLLNAAMFAVAALLLFFAAFAILDRLVGRRLWAEVLEGKNVAAAILAGAFAIGIATIIAAAFH